MSEIERLRAELTVETTVESLANVQSDFKQVSLDTQNQSAQLLAELLNTKKIEGDNLYGHFRGYSVFVDDAVRQTASALRELNQDELPRMEREQVDLEYDLNRLEALNINYASTTRELLSSWRDFDQAQDKRKDMRSKMAGFRDNINTHLDEDEKWSVNLDEVEQLC